MNEREVFANALQQSTDAQRASYLDAVCAGDPGLRARIQQLLQAERQLGSFIESPPAVPALTQDLPAATDKSGTTIGPYKLIQQIGEGGFGIVYLAEQLHPVRRKVALKVIKPGMDAKEVIARFEAERQALALMDHQHIAKVLDCGATATGAPYFVMELVCGVPITEYCDQSKLSTLERLELFVSVCQAVQHAHQKGIIHRDIKPSNILVSRHDGEAVPKIIDFGISKAIDRRLTEQSLFTEYGRMIGTPLYMSPEQAGVCGLDVDTRTDIYSLGVLLYELLTGTTPIEDRHLDAIGYDEIRRIICDEDPVRPSTKISTLGEHATTVSAHRQTDPKRLSAILRRDLDWIVMKALEKDRDRRYETASSLAADIRRYLNNEPVEAFPPSPAYRFFKFARRNKRTLATAAALAAMLVVGTCVSAWLAIRAKQSEREAKAEAAASEAVVAFLNRDLLGQADPSAEPDRDLTVREALDRASAKIPGRFTQQPLVEAAIRHAVGTAYLTLGEAGKAEQQLLVATEIRRRFLGPEHRRTLASRTHLGITFFEQGRHVEAEQLHADLLKIQRRLLGEDDPLTLASMMNLAAAIHGQGRFDEAQELSQRLLRLQRRVLGAEHPNTLKTMINLAIAMRIRGRQSEAEQLCRELLQIQQRVLRKEHPDTLNTMSVLANSLLAQGRHAEAEAAHQQVHGIRSRVLGPEHPATLSSMNNLALAIFRRGQYAEAEQLRRELLELQRRVLGDEHPSTLNTMMNLAIVLQARGLPAGAEQLHRQVLEKRREVLGEEHPDTLLSMQNMAAAISAQGRDAEAEQRYLDLIEVRIRVSGPEHPDTLKAMMNLGVAIHKQRRYAEAEKLRRDVVAAMTRVLGPEHPDTLGGMLNLANSIYAQGRRAEAERHYQEVLQKMRHALGENHPSALKCMMALARSAEAGGRHLEAEQRLRRVLAVQRTALGSEHPDTLRSITALSWFLCFSAPPEQRSPTEAVALARESLQQRPDDGRTLRILGQAQYRAGEFREALESLHKAIEVGGGTHHEVLTLALVHWHLDEKDRARMLYEPLRSRKLTKKCHIRLKGELQSLLAADEAVESAAAAIEAREP